MVSFVYKPVYGWVVLEAVDEVDPRVGEEDEERVLQVRPYTPWNIEWGMEVKGGGGGVGEIV